MRARFWGTRGSIPVALPRAAIRDKIVAALVAAAGRGIDTVDKARAFVDRELDFTVASTFGGDSSCVELVTGGDEYVLCDLGSGARVFGNMLDPNSDIRWVLENKRVFVLKEELGTRPRFFYFFDE